MTAKKATFCSGQRDGKIPLLWVVLGHQDQEEMKDGKCATCGAIFNDWRAKVAKQHDAVQEDCCKGFVLTKPQGGRKA